MNSAIIAANAAPVATDQVNILIVDDEPRNLTVLESVLEDPAYRLVRASSGEQALLALMAEEFAVLVLDVRMPGMTGFELAQIVKQRKRTARVPIIFLTAYYNEDQHILEGYGSGAVDYLHKPVNAAVLRSKVAVFAELYRKGNALEIANRVLLAEVTERRRAEARLRELNESLDRRVTERTDALQASEAKLRDANRRKDEFLATLAHELRNPLAPVRTAVQALRMDDVPMTRVQWASQIIDRQVHSMTRLIDDLMDVSRINRDRIELRKERVDLANVLRDAADATRPLIEEYKHELTLQMPEQELLVDADPTRLAQVFMNLLNNAAKYMDPGGRIEVRVDRREGEVAVTVRDAGIGIPSDRLESVFEMFSQIDTALSRSRGGLGIGLSLTRRLVQLHGGSVVARSDGRGKGSEFEVLLPLAPDSQVASPGPVAPVLNRPAVGFRILVADDNEDAAATIAMLLETQGYEVRIVHRGEAAVRAAAEFKPQVALLDIGMPGINGYEACRQIRAQEGGRDITLIAVTGWGQPEDRSSSQSAGFDQHLVKPVDPIALMNLIADLAN